jgi:hypothetical protein
VEVGPHREIHGLEDSSDHLEIRCGRASGKSYAARLPCGKVRAVIHRAQATPAEQLRERIGIDLIALVPRPRGSAPITDDDVIDERRH